MGRRLLLDLQGAQDPRNGDRGIGRAVIELAAELDSRPGVVSRLLLNPLLPVPDHIPEALRASPVAFRVLLVEAMENSLDNALKYFRDQARRYRAIN